MLSPVVNPLSYGDQLGNVKSDGSGNVSPEGQAFVLLMEAARRDYLEAGGKAGEAVQVSEAGRAGGGKVAVMAVVVVAAVAWMG